ncbi:MAG: hypothetical protein ACT4OU_10810 [Hyphomicrobium sp.]
MSDSRLSLNAIAQPVNHTMTLIKFAVFAVSVAAAVPTARDLYYSWQTGVPYTQVGHRLSQADLLEKNFGCDIKYTTISNASGARVEVGSCPKSGDIAIRVTRGKNDTNLEWIAFDQLPKPGTSTASVLDLFISKAVADERLAETAPGTVRVAQATVEVLCQGKQKDMLVRVTRENGKCKQESVSIFKGTVEQSIDVPCDKACPIPN